jgi:carbamoyl-phosphate synthase large subunit
MKRKILVTGAGGGGSTNLINSLRKSGRDLHICGSNLDPAILAKSTADEQFLLPVATDDAYITHMSALVEQQGIELVIPNSDREVHRVSQDRDLLPCRTYLPPHDTVVTCQEKFRFYECMTGAGLPVARSCDLRGPDDIEPAIDSLRDTGDRFRVRPRRGSGSRGATWVNTAEQARAWIGLWTEMRDFSVSDFMISEFLPGRDYACQSIWRDGELVCCKLAERLEYYMGFNRLSGMSSTPQKARTLRDDDALETVFRAIHAVCDKPHGNFCMDMKGGSDGRMHVCEINIGRFFMITPIFDLTGTVNMAGAYVRLACGEDVACDDPIDIEEDMFLLRDLDTLPTIVPGSRLTELEGTRPLPLS